MGQEHKSQLSAFKIDISHQEMERIVSEIEALYETTRLAGGEWLSVEALANWLCHELGYEDTDEFEDALHGTFIEFLEALPNIELGKDERERDVLKVKPTPPESEWRHTVLTLPIRSRQDLWNVLLKSPQARVELPELEFEISEDRKRKVDSVYNHIAAAIFNLGTHVRTVPMEEDTKNKIVDCIMALNILLDVEVPWTLVVHDPSGQSDFSDMESVGVQYVDNPIAPAAEAEAGVLAPAPDTVGSGGAAGASGGPM